MASFIHQSLTMRVAFRRNPNPVVLLLTLDLTTRIPITKYCQSMHSLLLMNNESFLSRN